VEFNSGCKSGVRRGSNGLAYALTER
jgi:hypothetical protein